MNKKFILALLSSPVVFMSILSMVVMGQAAQASQNTNQPGTRIACIRDPHKANRPMVCERVSNKVVPKTNVEIAQAGSNQITELEFTDQESDEAIKLFGCDCPVCINAIRQLHGAAPMPV
jgi:hypothetical protein